MTAALPLPDAQQLRVPARRGDLCVLLVTTEPLGEKSLASVESLRRDYGGRLVDPLHVTCDRFATGMNWERAAAAMDRQAASLRTVSVRVEGLLRLDRPQGNQRVLKYLVEETDEVRTIRRGVEAVRREAAVASAYAHETRFTVSVLEGVSDASFSRSIEPFALFAGDRLVLSRIRGPGGFQILHAVDLPA